MATTYILGTTLDTKKISCMIIKVSSKSDHFLNSQHKWVKNPFICLHPHVISCIVSMNVSCYCLIMYIHYMLSGMIVSHATYIVS